ncbi:MAG TPA: hypothetical protein VL424_15690 [Pararobbsia sp.]|nr:hypothetical protein [Pararobbsia sp.]
MCAICNFKIDFGVSHPVSLRVAVATRQAMDRGALAQQDMNGALATARLKLASVDTLAVFQSRIEATLSLDEWLALPDFYVLLIEATTWGFFHATPNGFDPDVIPALPDLDAVDPKARSSVIVTSEIALRALNDGKIDARTAFESGLVALDAPDAHARAVRSVIDRLSVDTHAHCPN